MTFEGGKLGQHREMPVLIDVDGVIANFCGAVALYIEDKFNLKIDQSKIYGDVRNEAGGLWDDECEAFIRSDGFALNLEEFPGAVDAVKEIMEKHEVVFVTSPYGESKTWCYDRYNWLNERFDITRDDIIFCRDKRFVQGVSLIDDRFENIQDWARFNNRMGILFDRPWNKKEQDELSEYRHKNTFIVPESDSEDVGYGFFSISDWRHIIELLDYYDS